MSRRGEVILGVAGVVLLVAGTVTIVVGLLTSPGPASFGWFAYAPLAQDFAFVPGAGMVITSRVAIVGCALLVAGLVVVAFFAGRRSATRRAN